MKNLLGLVVSFILVGCAIAVFVYSPALALEVFGEGVITEEVDTDGNNTTFLPESYLNDGIYINVAARKLILIRDGQPKEVFPVAVGRPENETPLGDFKITVKVSDPWWYPTGRQPVPSGPDNPLGKWWLGLNRAGYGVHGTNNESSIGMFVSDGCIRMKNEDVAYLVSQVEVGTDVRIVYDTVTLIPEIEEEQLSWHLGIYSDPYERTGDLSSSTITQFLVNNKRAVDRSKLTDLEKALAAAEFPVKIPTVLDPEGSEHPKALSIVSGEEAYDSPAFKIDDVLYFPLRTIIQGIVGDEWKIQIQKRSDDERIDVVRQIESILASDDVDSFRSVNALIHDGRNGRVLAEANGLQVNDEIYVPQDYFMENMWFDFEEIEDWIYIDSKKFSFFSSTVSIFPCNDEAGEDMIPAQVLERLFRKRVHWDVETRDVRLLDKSLEDVVWLSKGHTEERSVPWISISEVAEFLNMDLLLEDDTVGLK